MINNNLNSIKIHKRVSRNLSLILKIIYIFMAKTPLKAIELLSVIFILRLPMGDCENN